MRLLLAALLLLAGCSAPAPPAAPAPTPPPPDGAWGFAARPVDGRLEVTRVAAASPAGRAGLQPGDVLLSVDGRAVDSVPELAAALAERDAVSLEVFRWPVRVRLRVSAP